MMGVDMDTGIIASGVHISIFFPRIFLFTKEQSLKPQEQSFSIDYEWPPGERAGSVSLCTGVVLASPQIIPHSHALSHLSARLVSNVLSVPSECTAFFLLVPDCILL